MFKFNRMFSSLLIAAELVFVAYSYCHASNGEADSPWTSQPDRWQQLDGNGFSLSWQTRNEPEPPKPLEPGGSQWRDIFSGEPPKDEDNTGVRSRGGFCPIAPSGFSQPQVVLNDRPLFLWEETRTNVTRLEVRDGDDMENSTQLWAVEPTDNPVQYDGEALEPGRTYYWMVFFNGASGPTLAIPFQIAEAADRDRIAAELEVLLAQLPEDADAEETARTRAQYFAENGLPSDALLEAFSVVEPSDELTEVLEALPQEYCRKPETDSPEGEPTN